MGNSIQPIYGTFDDDGKLISLRQNTRDGVNAPGLVQSLSVATGGAARGFAGNCTADNFMMNWIRRPFGWDGISGTASAAYSNVGTLTLRTGLDNGPVSIHGGTECAGWVRVFFGLSANGAASGLFEAGTTTMIDNRMADLRYLLQFWHRLGKKVLLVLDGPVTSAAGDATLFRDRVTQLLQRLPMASVITDEYTYIDAIAAFNEPFEALGTAFPGTVATAGYAKLAELSRVLATLFRAMSPRTIVCSPTFQGGEGNTGVEGIMAASAAGVVVRGDGGGAGTRGEQFWDVITFHPYGIATTLALANLNASTAYTEQTIRTYSAFIETAIANRRLASDGGSAFWAGRADYEFWATEVNINFNGAQITSNTDFRFQACTSAQKVRHMGGAVHGCFSAGFSKVGPYAPDHFAVAGPWAPTGFAVGANGDIRVTAGSEPVFDGDLVLMYTNNVPYAVHGIAYNATANGLAYDVAGVPSNYVPNYSAARRYLLGGWHAEWAAIQASFTGVLDTGFWVDDSGAALPQLQLNRGVIQRTVAGRLQIVVG